MDKIFTGDALTILKSLPNESVQTCVTSPPYWRLRDYGVKGQLGLEQTPEQYVAAVTAIFKEVRRVLRSDGTLWLNLGDSYSGSSSTKVAVKNPRSISAKAGHTLGGKAKPKGVVPGLKPKDLVGIPWRVVLALQADGWFLRQDIIWHKPNPMPESVTDRCTKAHEYLFLLSKSVRYFYDCDAIREPYGDDWQEPGIVRARKYGYAGKGAYQDRHLRQRNGKYRKNKKLTGDLVPFGPSARGQSDRSPTLPHPMGKNKRSVWSVYPKPYKGAHFATFPPALVEPCILAGAPIGGIVLDPFLGSGTTAAVARRLGRSYIGIELNRDYVRLARERIAGVAIAGSAT